MLKNQFQDLMWAKTPIKAYIKQNSSRGRKTSLSGLFKLLRKRPHLSLIGDYSLLWIAINELKKIGRRDIQRAYKYSFDFKQMTKKEKMIVTDYLQNTAIRFINFENEAKSKSKTAGNWVRARVVALG